MVIFNIHGHKNILGTHRNTIEFTKESNLTLNGDCIIGVKADFDLHELKALVKKYSKLEIIITVEDLMEEFIADSNPDFNDEHEIVIRKTDFISERTLGIKADKAVRDLNHKLINKLKNPETVGKVELIGIE